MCEQRCSNRRSGDWFCRQQVSSRRNFAPVGSLSYESPGESSFRLRRCGRGPVRRVIVSSRVVIFPVASCSHVVTCRHVSLRVVFFPSCVVQSCRHVSSFFPVASCSHVVTCRDLFQLRGVVMSSRVVIFSEVIKCRD